MRKPVLAVDFDDVIAGFNTAFARYNAACHGTTVTYNDITNYDMTAIYGMTLPELFKRVEHFCHHHHDMVEPIPGAVSGLVDLAADLDLHVVTSRCESLHDVTHRWVSRNVSGLITDIHFTNNFGTRHPDRRRSKLSVCKEIGAIGLIDDALSHAKEVATAGIPAILPNRPWNRGSTPQGVSRVDHWHEVVSLVRKNFR